MNTKLKNGTFDAGITIIRRGFEPPLAVFEKSERQRAQSTIAVIEIKITFGDALAVFKQRINGNPRPQAKNQRITSSAASRC